MVLSEVTTNWGSDGTIINRVALLTWVMSSIQNVVTLRKTAWYSETNISF